MIKLIDYKKEKRSAIIFDFYSMDDEAFFLKASTRVSVLSEEPLLTSPYWVIIQFESY